MGTPLREDIAAAKQNWLIAFGANREIRLLHTYLHTDEKVESMCAGTYGDGRGLVVATNHRVFFVKDGWFKKVTQDFPYHAVSSLEWKSGFFLGDLVIFGDGSAVQIAKLEKKAGSKIAKLIQLRQGKKFNLMETNHNVGASSNNNDNILAQLERLQKLKDGGVITQGEFERQKQLFLA